MQLLFLCLLIQEKGLSLVVEETSNNFNLKSFLSFFCRGKNQVTSSKTFFKQCVESTKKEITVHASVI